MTNSPVINPYEVPAVPQCHEYAPHYRLFSVPVIASSAFFLNLPPAIALMMLNFIRVGRFRAAWSLLAAGTVVSVCFLIIQMQISGSAISYLSCAFASGLVALISAQWLQGRILREHQANDGMTVPLWLSAVISVGVEVVYLAVVIAIFLVLPESWLPEGW